MGRSFYIGIFVGFVLLLASWKLTAQQNFSDHGPLSLRERQSQVKPGSLISNVVRVINSTSRSAEYSLETYAPAGWSVVGVTRRNFIIQAGDTAFFPVRIIASQQINNERSQIARISLFRFGSPLANVDWVINPLLRYEWSARIERNRIVLPADADTTSFNIHIRNEGDLEEVLNLNLNLPDGLLQINERGEPLDVKSLRLLIDPQKDTTLRVFLRFMDQDSEMESVLFPPTGRSMRLRASIASERDSQARTWGSNVEIKKLEDRWIENTSKRLTMPLTAEFNAYDIMQENSYGTFALYGSHVFNPETTFTYYFLSNYSSNYLNPQAFLGQYLQLNFQPKFFGVELGNITQNNEGAGISGEGARVTGRYEQHQLDVAYMRNPGMFSSQKHINALGVEYNYFGREIRGGAWSQIRENFTQKTEEEIAGGHVSYRFLRNQFIRVSAGVSRQTHKWKSDSIFDLTGFGYRINYNGSYDRLNYNFSWASSTPTHIARRGMDNLNSRIAWRFNTTHNIFAAFSHYTSDPDFYFQGELREMSLFRQRQIYRLGYQYRGQYSDVTFQPLHTRSEDPFIVYNNSGMELDYRLKDLYNIRFFSSVFAGYTAMPELQDLDPFFVARLRMSIRYFDYSLNMRYYYGPYYNNELRRFAEDRRNANRFSANLNFDQSFADGRLFFQMSAIYNYTTYNKQNSLSLRPELFYFPQPGLRFGIYGRYYGLSVDQDDMVGIPDLGFEGAAYSSNRYEFGFSIRKDMNVPVSGIRYFDYTVMVYRDISGTGSYQSGDPGVPEIWIRLQQLEPMSEDRILALSGQRTFEALTGKDGKVSFVNIPPGNYLLTMVPVGAANKRHEARTWEVMINRNQTMYLSADMGARISGNIILERDQFTRAEYFPLGGIRVTATNETGDTFNTLTTESGQYSLYLPRGKYTLSINENVFGPDFNLQQNDITIEIMHEQEELNISFVARERGRQIRIQRPGNDEPE
ncbi:MAG: hypothetical protein ABR597_06720 [Bacteroidales bacterium]